MDERQAGQEQRLKKLVSSFRCQVCRRGFEREHIRVAARHEQLWIVSVRCRQCRNLHEFWVALREVDDLGTAGDLSPAEEAHFATLPPVSSDDLLDVHEFLAGFDGDFAALFADRSRRS